MNTTFNTWHLTPEDEAKVEGWVAFVEDKLSRFRPMSELSLLNASAGQPFVMGPLLYAVMADAIQYYKLTDGLFNPFLGKVIAGLGYGKSFDELEPLAGFDFSGARWAGLDHPFRFDPMMKALTLDPEVHVDLGGIGKSWCAEAIARELRKSGAARGAINAGGDVLCWGDAPDGQWEIAIMEPYDPESELCKVRSKSGFAVATSSQLKRRWQDASGKPHHHLIDPRTQQSADSDLLQVSVVASDLTLAEIYTKCILILGSERGLAWSQEMHPGLAVIAVRDDQTVLQVGNFTDYAIERMNTHE
jgi:thiamine biosynthesis lipoprotein